MSRIEEVEAAIRTADPERCLAALRGATEAERRAAAPRVLDLAKWDGAVLQRDFQRRRAQNSVAVLAVYGTASLAQVERLRGPDTYHSVFPVLADRRPAWLQDWAEWIVTRPGFPHFADVRCLIRKGLIEKPAGEGYVLGVIRCLAPGRDVRTRLAQEPDVFSADVWRFFEVEGTPGTSLASVDKFSGGWKDGLLTLAAEGTLDRSRLLDRSLDALEREFAPFRATWFSAFHEALGPTIEEAALRAGRYLGLLGSRTPATVSFAMKAAVRLERAGRIGPAEVCETIGPALAVRQKGVVLQALKLLSRIVRSAPEFAPQVAESAAAALAHESPGVQKAALDLMERCAGPNGQTETAAARHTRFAVSVIEEEAPLPERPAPAALEPIRCLDELVEAFAAVLEKEEPPEEIERVLDGVSRLCGERGKRFEALTAPLVARARKLPGAVLSPLALAWTRGVRPHRDNCCAGLISFLWTRVDEAAERCLRGRPGPLIGVPSLSGGPLDPLVFAERLQLNPEPGPLDLIQALLRLGPGNRAEALALSKNLRGETGAAVRHALGAERGKALARPGNAALWIAAEQARDPGSGAPEFGLHWRREKRIYGWGEEQEQLFVDLQSSRPLSQRLDHPADLTANPGTQDATMLRWCATVWPWNREGFYAAGAQTIARNLDWWSAEWGNRVYLDTLAADPLPYGPMAYELLALGLACKDGSEALAASGALIHGLASGRVTGKALGETCARLAKDGKITISRWTKRLGAVARIRRAFAWELFAVQDRLLAAPAPIGQNEMSGFLELLCELRAQSGLDLSREARLRLESSVPGGKSGKLAKSLL